MLTTDRLLDIISDAGLDARSYSGRGMFGKYCVGFSCYNLQTAISKILPHCVGLQDASDIIKIINVDNLGCDIIIYWPHCQWMKL